MLGTPKHDVSSLHSVHSDGRDRFLSQERLFFLLVLQFTKDLRVIAGDDWRLGEKITEDGPFATSEVLIC